MQPYDPSEARSVSSYRTVQTVHATPNRARTKKIFHGIALGVLVVAVAGLIYLNWYESKVIALQRHLILDLWDYIQAGCPNPTSYASR